MKKHNSIVIFLNFQRKDVKFMHIRTVEKDE